MKKFLDDLLDFLKGYLHSRVGFAGAVGVLLDAKTLNVTVAIAYEDDK